MEADGAQDRVKSPGSAGSASAASGDSIANTPAEAAQVPEKAAKRHTQRTQLGHMRCRGCNKNRLASYFACNQVLDFACKRARDNLWKIAKQAERILVFQ